MDFNSENIIKMRVFVSIIILLLNTHLSVVVELTSEKQMIGRFNFQIIT